MKVLGFMGSPRIKGNTAVLVDTFLKGAATAGAEVERFDLVNLAINQCRGCFRKCILKPGYRCGTFRDDMDMLLREMVSADLMLFASPYYCASYTAIMARFLERCLPLWEAEVVGELGTMNAFRFINTPLKGKKAVIGLVQDFKESARILRSRMKDKPFKFKFFFAKIQDKREFLTRCLQIIECLGPMRA